MKSNFIVYSVQKRINRKRERKVVLQKAKEKAYKQYLECFDDQKYKCISKKWYTNFVVGIWNDQENKMEFAEDFYIKGQRLEEEIQLLNCTNRVE